MVLAQTSAGPARPARAALPAAHVRSAAPRRASRWTASSLGNRALGTCAPRHRAPRSAALLLAALLLVAAGAAGAQTAPGRVVRFPSVPAPGEKGLVLRGWFTQPDVPQGRGRVPGIVLMHGCGGPKAPSHRWAAQLAAWGYAALVLDSFGPRGILQVCSDSPRLLPTQRTGDAYGALQFLQGQRGVDPDRIGLMGWSHGGSSALWAVEGAWSLAHQPYPWLRFRATSVFYPSCNFSHPAFTTPVLMLMGSADDWTPASPCRRMIKTAAAGDSPIQLVVYPGATHAFDAVRMTVEAYGHTLEYNPGATLDAQYRVREFFDKYLR